MVNVSADTSNALDYPALIKGIERGIPGRIVKSFPGIFCCIVEFLNDLWYILIYSNAIGIDNT